MTTAAGIRSWRLIGTVLGLALALAFAFAVAGSLGQLIAVLVVALPHSLVVTAVNAFLFAHLGGLGGSRAGAVIGGLAGGLIGAIESLIVWRLSPTPPVLVVGIGAAIAYLLALIRTFARSFWDRADAAVNRVLDIEVGLPARTPAAESARALYYRPYPRRLEINWVALILGPVWYLLVGLWVHASILLSMLFLTGGALCPIVWLYCGLKGNEDLLEFRVARHNVY